MWKCDKCGELRLNARPGIVTTYPPSDKASQYCGCGGLSWLDRSRDICPACKGEELYSLRGDPVICWKCNGLKYIERR